MRFLCSTFGSAGDVFPMLGLAIELRNRGHEVVFSTNEYFESHVKEHGLEFRPLGTRDEFLNVARHPDLWHPVRGFGFIFNSICPVLREQYAMHCEFASRPNGVAIANALCFGANLAQETHRLPLITLHCQPAVIWSDISPPTFPNLVGPLWWRRIVFKVAERFIVDRIVGKKLNRWRAELGLPPHSRTMRSWNSPFGVLAMFPNWYAEPQSDWPQPMMQTDFPLWNHRAATPLSTEIADFLKVGTPPIAATPGSANVQGERFFAAVVEACRRLNERAVLLTEFPEQLPHDLPKSMLAVRYVPLDQLLPHCKAFIHHGGIGSASQAMLAGIPQILMPMAHDQFDNAARIARLKLGGSISAPKFGAERLVRSLHFVLNSQDTSEACVAISRRLASRGGIKISADALEAHVAHL